jgi:hypothetical protein
MSNDSITQKMSKVFAGSDDSFVSAWQIWKRRNKENESFVLAQGDTVVFRTTTEGGNEEYSWYVGIEEAELPEDVEVNGCTVRDKRAE